MIRTLVLAAALARVTHAALPCDDVNADCDVITTENFANALSVQVEAYPAPSSTIVGGVTYDVVYHWAPEQGHSLTHTFDIYTTDAAGVSCADSKVWNNGVEVAFVEEDRSGLSVCVAPISGAFNRDDLLYPTDVYLLLKNVVAPGAPFFVDRNYDNQIAPKADAVFYLYELFSTTLSTDPATGTTITLQINDIEYDTPDFGGVGSCNTMGTTMATIDLNCASAVNGNENTIVYASVITLPVHDNADCFYFRTGDHQQSMNVELDISSIENTGKLFNRADVVSIGSLTASRSETLRRVPQDAGRDRPETH